MLVRRAAWDDVPAAASVLADAFADYAWTRWTIDGRDHQQRIAALQRLALERYGLPFGQVWVGELDDEIVSVAVWMDSAIPVPHDESVAAETAELEGDRHSAAVEATAALAGWPPAQRHFCLATVGTARGSQRQGIATKTLRPVLDNADETRVPAYLETSAESNIAFYRRLGFDVTHHVRIDQGPDVWAMLRPPRART